MRPKKIRLNTALSAVPPAVPLAAILATAMALALAFGGAPLFAQTPDTPPESQADSPPGIDPDLEKPPPLPPKIQDEQIEPTVVIREEEDRRIEEYSLDGRVYMVKVTPLKGPPYYYIDTDGDGTLELDERSRALNPVQPAYWKIKEWD